MWLLRTSTNPSLKTHRSLPFLSALFVDLKSSTSSSLSSEVDKIARIINDHSFPDQPLQPIIARHAPLRSLSQDFVGNVLGRLFAAHANGLKALEFFRYSLKNPNFAPSSDSFEKTLHILTRMRYFDKAWTLMAEMRDKNPNLLTLKSMSIILCKIAKFGSYEETLEAFARMEDEIFKREFGTDEFNVLLRAFCSEREMKEARSVFVKMHPRFTPDTKTMNILLLGFKASGDVPAMELFYHEMVKRGFKPNALTFNIRINGFCKNRCLGDALRLFDEMDRVNCVPTLETLTTLIHGAGVARNKVKVLQLFDEIPKRHLQPDVGAYNALISALIKCRDVNSAIELMNEMEEKGIGHDNVTYHTVFRGVMKSKGFEGTLEIYNLMKERTFAPETRTVVMLMKFFCQNGNMDLGLDLWNYMLEKGYCPHSHALDLLAMGLCSRGRVREAFECSKRMVERGRCVSEAVCRMLERGLLQKDKTKELEELKRMMMRLHSVLPSSSGGKISHYSDFPNFTDVK